MDPLSVLGPFVCFQITLYLSRRDCVQWSRCARHCYEHLAKYCHLRLTQKQADVVDQMMKLDREAWRREKLTHWIQNGAWHGAAPQYANNCAFPAEYVITTGTSTGKTAMALAAASKWVRQHKPCLLVVLDAMVPQWVEEHKKFSEYLGLAALDALRDRPSIERAVANFDLTAERILLVPKTWLKGPAATALQTVAWYVVICDEAVSVPKFLVRNITAFGISLNAAAGKKQTIANHAEDNELGSLPALKFKCYSVPRFSDGSYFQLIGAGAVFEDSQNITPRERYQEEYEKWLARCIPEGEYKSVVISADRIRTEKSQSLKFAKNATELVRLDRATHVISRVAKVLIKSEAIVDFQKSKTGLLFGPASYLAKGFNLPADHLLILNLNGNMSPKILLQIIGRVRRVQTGHSVIKVSLVSGDPNAWKLPASLFYKTTTQIIDAANTLGDKHAFRALGIRVQELDNVHRFCVDSRVPRAVVPETRTRQEKVDAVIFYIHGFTDAYVLPDYCAMLWREKSGHVSEKFVPGYWYLVLVRCLSIEGDAYVRFVEYGHNFNSDTCFRTSSVYAATEDAILRFRKRFMRITKTDWDARARFKQQPDATHYLVGYDCLLPKTSAQPPPLECLKKPKKSRDASPMRT